MIVLKAACEKVLQALQAISEIVERKHTRSIIANIIHRRAPVAAPIASRTATRSASPSAVPVVAMLSLDRTVYPRAPLPCGPQFRAAPHAFFSSQKVSGRNCP
jgi:hypothetical protein